MGHQIGIVFALLKHSVHTLQNPGVDIPRNIPKIRRDVAFHKRTPDFTPLMIHFVNNPDPTRNGDFISDRRWFDDGSELFGPSMNRVLDILPKDGIEFVVINDPLSGNAENNPTILGTVDMVDFQEMIQKKPVILLTDAVKTAQRQNPGSKLCRCHLPTGSESAHRLMIEETVGQAIHPRRLHKTLFNIKLYQRNSLQEVPGNAVRQHGSGFPMVFTHNKPHFRRIAPATRAPHTLQKTGHSKRCINLKCPLQPADVYTEFQCGGCAYTQERIIILHFFLGTLPIGCRKIAMMNEESIRLPVRFTVLPEILANGFTLLARVSEDQTLLPFCMLKNITDPGISRFRSSICGWFEPRC